MEVNLKIEYVPLDSLRPYENNARRHSEEDVDAIVHSINEFGFDDPIGVWGDGLIVEGHGRLEAAKKLGMTEVPIIRLDHLTDEQRRAYALAHNKTAELSGWDFEILAEELENIVDIDMTALGFDEQDDLFGYMENDSFVDPKEYNEWYNFTLCVPVRYKMDVLEYIRNNGKDKLTDLVIEEVSRNA